MDVQKHGIGKPLTGLTVGAGVRGHLHGRAQHKEPWLGKGFHGVWQPVLFEGRTETTGHFHGGEEEETVSELGGENEVSL